MNRRRKTSVVALAAALAFGGASATIAEPSAAAVAAQSCPEATPVYSQVAPPALALLQAEQAWTRTRGEGVTVAVVDSGVNGADPRLAHAVVPGIDLVASGDGRTDEFGHGTVIAGIIAAAATERSEMQGLAPGVQIMPIRVYRSSSTEDRENGVGPSVAGLAAGIRAAADRGAQIINVSMSTPYAYSELVDAVAYATRTGSLVVASAGNTDGSSTDDVIVGPADDADQGDAHYPAAAAGALAVTALSAERSDSPGGQVTSSSVHGGYVDLAAPGQDVLSLGLNGGDCTFGEKAPATSYATAYVSAAAALVAAAHPDETPAQWTYRLEATALRANAQERDDAAGWGIVQPYQAIALVPGADTPGPENPFAEATPEPTQTSAGITIAGDDGSQAREADRVLYVTLATAAVLMLAGIIGVFITRRRRVAD